MQTCLLVLSLTYQSKGDGIHEPCSVIRHTAPFLVKIPAVLSMKQQQMMRALRSVSSRQQSGLPRVRAFVFLDRTSNSKKPFLRIQLIALSQVCLMLSPNVSGIPLDITFDPVYIRQDSTSYRSRYPLAVGTDASKGRQCLYGMADLMQGVGLFYASGLFLFSEVGPKCPGTRKPFEQQPIILTPANVIAHGW